MIISNMKLRLVPSDDPRHPSEAVKGALYLLECDTDHGSREATFIMYGDDCSAEHFGQMLDVFAAAVRRMGKAEAA